MIEKKRRIFLKKAAYKAPALLLLGTLTRPQSAKADFSGGPPGPPGGGTPYSSVPSSKSASKVMKPRKRLRF
jgi:hypothetical protein